jgi:hypothetical protein
MTEEKEKLRNKNTILPNEQQEAEVSLRTELERLSPAA